MKETKKILSLSRLGKYKALILTKRKNKMIIKAFWTSFEFPIKIN